VFPIDFHYRPYINRVTHYTGTVLYCDNNDISVIRLLITLFASHNKSMHNAHVISNLLRVISSHA